MNNPLNYIKACRPVRAIRGGVSDAASLASKLHVSGVLQHHSGYSTLAGAVGGAGLGYATGGDSNHRGMRTLGAGISGGLAGGLGGLMHANWDSTKQIGVAARDGFMSEWRGRRPPPPPAGAAGRIKI